MKKVFCFLVGLAALASPASAQSTAPSHDAPRLLVTPFVALGDDLAPGLGGAVSFAWTRSVGVEAEASVGSDAARTSLSLVYSFPRIGRFTPYAAGGGGVQRDEISSLIGGFPSVETTKTKFALNVGAGVTVPIRDRWSYRADFRWYNPEKAWPESWRVFSGVGWGLGR